MVRKYVRKRQPNPWSDEDFKLARNEVLDGKSIQSVAQKYGISRKVLGRSLQNKCITTRIGRIINTLFCDVKDNKFLFNILGGFQKHFLINKNRLCT